ncbi:uncharacterized protein BDV17DRAFT_290479 [Aspergillus undulatus]|uniref:uncharacterized protein n=1 Tax=Aspergillus undulatus TaxID=1810928 RepID=UPI003CCE5416
MDDIPPSYSHLASPRPAPSSSRYTTPEQSPDCSSFPLDVSDITPRSSMDASSYNFLLQQLVPLITDEDDFVRPFLERFLENQRNEKIVQRKLREAKDRAEEQLDKERVRADASERERDAARDENRQLNEMVQTIQNQLAGEVAKKVEIQDQLKDRDNQLADAAHQISNKQAALIETLDLYSRMQEEKNKLQGRLELVEEELTKNQKSSDRQLADLSTLQGQFKEEQSQRKSAEEQLYGKSDELTQIRNELNEEKLKNAELETKLDLERKEAVDTLRSETSRLQTLNNQLETELAGLRDGCSVLERQVNGLEEQRRATAGQMERVNKALRDQQSRTTGLQSTISNLEQERNQLHSHLQQLHTDHKKIADANTALQLARNTIEQEKHTLEVRCTVLNAELAKLKATIDQFDNARAKLPCRLATMKRRNSSRNL